MTDDGMQGTREQLGRFCRCLTQGSVADDNDGDDLILSFVII